MGQRTFMARIRRLSGGLLVLSALICLEACGWTGRLRSYLFEDEKGSAALQVGENEYSRDDLNRFFDTRLSEFRDPADADKVKSNLLDSFIDERLLLREAESLKIEPDRKLLKAMMEQIAASSPDSQEGADPNQDAELEKNIVESLKMQQYLHDHLLKNISITEQECEAYYDKHQGDYVRNDVVHVREILVDNEEQARKIADSLASNRSKNFAEMARLFSRAPSAGDGGNLGTFQRGELPEEFENVVFKLPPGTASKIVRTKYGYHIFLVEEKVRAHQQRFWEVKEQIRERLQQERERELITNELAELAAKVPVIIHRERLDFNYVGSRFASR